LLENADGGTGQVTETIRASEGTHILKSTDGELVRTRKESERARGTHVLWSADGGTHQDTETIRASEGHSLPRERRRRDSSGQRNNPSQRRHSHPGEHRWRKKSGHGSNLSKRGALTCWRAQTEGLVRTQKQSERVRGTHLLESADGGTRQDTETI
jgi:hypothetical protein